MPFNLCDCEAERSDDEAIHLSKDCFPPCFPLGLGGTRNDTGVMSILSNIDLFYKGSYAATANI